jgi:uncharacterized protein (DUF302 family)
MQYLVGNPLFAIQMTQHDIRAGLYAPLRVLIYEDETGKTFVEYDRPSTLFGQFGNTKVTEVAAMLDRKLEELLADAIRSSRPPRESSESNRQQRFDPGTGATP